MRGHSQPPDLTKGTPQDLTTAERDCRGATKHSRHLRRARARRLVSDRKKSPIAPADHGRKKNQACAAVKRAAEEEWGHAHAGLLFKLATPPRQHRARR